MSVAVVRVAPVPMAPFVRVVPVKPNRYRAIKTPSVAPCATPLPSASKLTGGARVKTADVGEKLYPGEALLLLKLTFVPV